MITRRIRAEDINRVMSGAEIIRELGKHSRKTMEGVTTNSFGRSMTRLGVKRVGHHDTDGYLVLSA